MSRMLIETVDFISLCIMADVYGLNWYVRMYTQLGIFIIENEKNTYIHINNVSI